MSARDWIAARRELLDAATEGPWLSTDVYPLVSPVQIDGFAHPVERAEAVAQAGADSALIADARTSLPMALDALHAVLNVHEGDHLRASSLGCVCPTHAAYEAACRALRVEP